MIRRMRSKVPFAIEGEVTSVDKSYILKSGGAAARRAEYGDGNLFFKKPPIAGSRHPWQIQLSWHDEITVRSPQGNRECRRAGYYLSIEPGFVNGLDPYIDAANAYPSQIPIRSLDPAPARAYSFGSKTRPEPGFRVPGLLERPYVWIPHSSFTNITTKTTPRAAIRFFEEKHGYDSRAAAGIGSGQSISISNDSGVTIEQNQVTSNLWIGSSDVYLSTARPAAETKVTIGAFPVTSIEYTTQYSDRQLSLYGKRSRLRFGTMPVKPPIKERAAMKVAGAGYEDDGEDHIKVATIYILSGDQDPSANTLPSFVGSESWYVQHFLFWNLESRSRNQDPNNIPPTNASLALLPVVGRYTVAPIFAAAAMESMLNEAINDLLNDQDNEAKYWTV